MTEKYRISETMKLPQSTVERILRQAGAERVSKAAVRVFSEWMEELTEEIAKEAGSIAEHSSRRTIIENDILLARKRLRDSGTVFK